MARSRSAARRALLGELKRAALDPQAYRADYSEYVGRPVEFVVEILRRPHLLKWQREFLTALYEHRQHLLQSCNAIGKTELLRWIILFHAVVMGGLVVFLSASEKQTRAHASAKIAAIVAAAGMAGESYLFGSEFPSGGEVLFAASSEPSVLQGYHNVLVIADEAQALEMDQFFALMGDTVGENDILLLSGNPNQGGLGGPFHKMAVSPDPRWHRVILDATEIVADPEHPYIPGLITKAGIEDIRQAAGEESSEFQSRVRGQWPSQPSDAMFPAAHVEAAFARWTNADFAAKERRRKLTLGIDVASSEAGDENVIAVARGGYVERLIAWHEKDTMKSVGRIIIELRSLMVNRRQVGVKEEMRLRQHALGVALLDAPTGDPLEYGGIPATLRVDEIGWGAGVRDRLAEQGYDVKPFNSSKRPEREADAEQFANLRAATMARLRTLIIQGRCAFPPDDLLRQELMAMRAFTNSSGKLQCVSKKEIRELIGRSCDRLDALAMAVAAADQHLDIASLPFRGPLPLA